MKIPSQYTPQNFCLKCVGCCRFSSVRSKWSPYFLPEEIKLFKKRGIPLSLRPKTKKAKLIFSKDYCFCPFFDPEKNRCTVYRLRPLDCTLYPFLLEEKREKVYLAVDKNCSYIAEQFGTREFKAYLGKLFRFLKQPKVAGYIRKNRRIIGNLTEKSVVSLVRLPFLEK
ncbi:MAG: YkgJ family cysteine cluster protein [Candidatus Omnitrophica bacterium]|nr:YkgJ family cysteine cluster protein [Candidatus Omnitrophota bacterium]MDD5611134.1 YkgJ family cysteine cluster protein [Candidatus Omnitrophota bacterium]